MNALEQCGAERAALLKCLAELDERSRIVAIHAAEQSMNKTVVARIFGIPHHTLMGWLKVKPKVGSPR